jgi:Fur family ferric uptake transcriptional regulator
VNEYHFAEEHHHYESRSVREHQHLICLNCGKVMEFACPSSQKMKADIGKRYDFDISTV